MSKYEEPLIHTTLDSTIYVATVGKDNEIDVAKIDPETLGLDELADTTVIDE